MSEKMKRYVLAAVLNLMFRAKNKTATNLEIRKWIRDYKGNVYNCLYGLLNEGYIQKIETKDNSISSGEEIKIYQITPKGVQFHLEYKKEPILKIIVFNSNDEITINKVKSFRSIGYVNIETIQLVFDMLCQEGFLEKKTSFTDNQENAIYVITEKARKLQSNYKQKSKAKERKTKAKKLKKRINRILENHPILNTILVGFIVIVGGLILGGILWVIISLF
jgi:DNA-binding PadR family transcriptional regulator